MTQFPLGMPNLPVHCKQGGPFLWQEENPLILHNNKKEKRKERRAHFAFSSMANQAHKVRDRKIGTWLLGHDRWRENEGKMTQRRRQSPTEKSFSKRVLENGVAGNSLGMAQDQTSARNFPVLPGKEQTLGCVTKIPEFLCDLLWSGWASSSTGWSKELPRNEWHNKVWNIIHLKLN